MNPSIDKLNEKLIKKVLDDDKSAILEFINLSEPLIWGALYKYDQFSDLEREDLFQDIFLKLFSNDKKRIRMWQGKAKFSTYLYMVTVNLSLDYLKSAGFVKAKNFDQIENINDQSHFVDFADIYSLKQAMNKLKENEKQVIDLYYFKQMKEKEIGEFLDKSINTISSLKFRAIKKMKLYLEEN